MEDHEKRKMIYEIASKVEDVNNNEMLKAQIGYEMKENNPGVVMELIKNKAPFDWVSFTLENQRPHFLEMHIGVVLQEDESIEVGIHFSKEYFDNIFNKSNVKKYLESNNYKYKVSDVAFEYQYISNRYKNKILTNQVVEEVIKQKSIYKQLLKEYI